MERLGSPLRDGVEHESIRPMAHAESVLEAGTRAKKRRGGAAKSLSAVEDMAGLSEASGPNIVTCQHLWLSNSLNFESIRELTLACRYLPCLSLPALFVIAGYDPQSSRGVALDPGSSPG
jgi:hypothetical protein